MADAAPAPAAAPAADPAAPRRQRVPLSYDKAALTLNETKTDNAQGVYCYCGGPWRDNEINLFCESCNQWFHGSCTALDLTGVPRFVFNYKFVCADCNRDEGQQDDSEVFERREGGCRALAITAFFNLTAQFPDKEAFTIKEDIAPYLEQHWESLWGYDKERTGSWAPPGYPTLASYLQKRTELFQFHGTGERSGNGAFSLVSKDPKSLATTFNKFKRITDDPLLSAGPSKKTRRGEKEAAPDPNGATMHPFNRDGFRYTPAELDPFTKEFYRAVRSEEGVHVSPNDRAPQLHLLEDRVTLMGEKGYSMARASHGVSSGQWYWEAEILPPEGVPGRPEPHVRIGWASQYANLQAPCGYDVFSYSWRDVQGTKFHMSKGQPFSEPYGPGDVLGFYISLPPVPQDKLLVHRSMSEKVVDYKHNAYFEEKDEIDKSTLQKLPESKIICYLNGQCKGVLFEELTEGRYFPAISLYERARVRCNFGPDFKYPPKDLSYAPMHDAVYRRNAELTVADLIFTVERREEKEKRRKEEEAKRAAAAEAAAAAAAAGETVAPEPTPMAVDAPASPAQPPMLQPMTVTDAGAGRM